MPLLPYAKQAMEVVEEVIGLDTTVEVLALGTVVCRFLSEVRVGSVGIVQTTLDLYVISCV